MTLTSFAVVATIAGFLVLIRWVRRPVQRSRTEVIHFIECALKTGGDSNWDDFVSVRIADPELETIRLKCLDVNFAPEAQFNATLQSILSELKAS
jgi:hypothetical protein